MIVDKCMHAHLYRTVTDLFSGRGHSRMSQADDSLSIASELSNNYVNIKLSDSQHRAQPPQPPPASLSKKKPAPLPPVLTPPTPPKKAPLKLP